MRCRTGESALNAMPMNSESRFECCSKSRFLNPMRSAQLTLILQVNSAIFHALGRTGQRPDPCAASSRSQGLNSKVNGVAENFIGFSSADLLDSHYGPTPTSRSPAFRLLPRPSGFAACSAQFPRRRTGSGMICRPPTGFRAAAVSGN